MVWNKHSKDLEGAHAFLGASKYHWINYTDEKLITTYKNYRMTEMGTRLHAFAAECIRLKQRLPANKEALNMYVNDAIKLRMTPEQLLYYSDNCFGTADTISCENGILRIHDLKTGVNPACMRQLDIYAALFCLEYGVRPDDLEIELRIYQSGTINKCHPSVEGIQQIMDKIVHFDTIIDELKMEES